MSATRFGWMTDGPPPQLFVPRENGKWVLHSDYERDCANLVARLEAGSKTLEAKEREIAQNRVDFKDLHTRLDKAIALLAEARGIIETADALDMPYAAAFKEWHDRRRAFLDAHGKVVAGG